MTFESSLDPFSLEAEIRALAEKTAELKAKVHQPHLVLSTPHTPYAPHGCVCVCVNASHTSLNSRQAQQTQASVSRRGASSEPPPPHSRRGTSSEPPPRYWPGESVDTSAEPNQVPKGTFSRTMPAAAAVESYSNGGGGSRQERVRGTTRCSLRQTLTAMESSARRSSTGAMHFSLTP